MRNQNELEFQTLKNSIEALARYLSDFIEYGKANNPDGFFDWLTSNSPAVLQQLSSDMAMFYQDLPSGEEINNITLKDSRDYFNILVNRILDLNRDESDESLLIFAARYHDKSLLESILTNPRIREKIDEGRKHLTHERHRWSGEDIVVEDLNSGYNALLFAVQSGYADNVKLLINAYANSDYKNHSGRTAAIVSKLNYHEGDFKDLLLHARLMQTRQLCEDLVHCHSKTQFEKIVEIQNRLGITKEEMVRGFCFQLYPDSREKAIAVINLALGGKNEEGNENTFLSDFMRKQKTSLYGTMEDTRTIDLLTIRRDALETLQTQVPVSVTSTSVYGVTEANPFPNPFAQEQQTVISEEMKEGKMSEAMKKLLEEEENKNKP